MGKVGLASGNLTWPQGQTEFCKKKKENVKEEETNKLRIRPHW